MVKSKAVTVLSLFTIIAINASAQLYNEYVQQGEVGITAGVAHYFGDLNTRAAINRPKPAVGLFLRKQFGNYVGLRISAHYAQVGYSDTYSKNEYQKTRNLSFNSNIVEFTVQGDFNFFKFIPADPDHLFTPYITFGAGVFYYDPYTFLNGKKEFLRPLGTEGQLADQSILANQVYADRKPYSTMALCFPLGVGVKYNLTNKINISFEITNRFTNTDYLDDVSTTYVGLAAVPSNKGKLLQDRSFEVNPNFILGTEGRQRGFSKQKDQYIIAEAGVSFNISSYKCPSAK